MVIFANRTKVRHAPMSARGRSDRIAPKMSIRGSGHLRAGASGLAVTKAGRWRLELLGPSAVVSVSDAAELLPGAHARRVAWLRARRLVRDLDGDSVVIWGDVLATLAGDARHALKDREPVSTDPWATLPRMKLAERPT